MVLALGVRRWRNHFLRRYNGSLQRCLIISQGFFAVLPMMAGDLGGFGSCVAKGVAGFPRLGRTTGAMESRGSDCR